MSLGLYGTFTCYDCKNHNKEIEESKIWIRSCKNCGKKVEVEKKKTWFICDECTEKIKQNIKQKCSKNICKRCNKEFSKDPSRRDYICLECREKAHENRKRKTTCRKCKKVLDRSFFSGFDFICIECKKATEKQEEELSYKNCKICNEKKKIHKEISAKSPYCFICFEKRNKKATSWERICPDCGTKVITTHPRITVIYCDNCKEKKRKISKDYKLKKLNAIKYDYCQVCKTKTVNELGKDRSITCDSCRPKMQQFKESCSRDGIYYKSCLICGIEFEVIKSRFWVPLYCRKCSTRSFGKGDHMFGYRGTAPDGHKYSSLHELDFDEWLVERKIKHEIHPRLKPTHRFSDFFLPEYNLYIEIDGMSREDDVDWYGKLSIYDKLGLKKGKDFLIVSPVSKHVIEDREVCFEELDRNVLPLLKKTV